MKRIFRIILSLSLVPVAAWAQSEESKQIQLLKETFHQEGLVALGFVAVLLVLMLVFLVVALKILRRSALGIAGQKTDQYRARHEQHMERVEQSLERVAKALEQKP